MMLDPNTLHYKFFELIMVYHHYHHHQLDPPHPLTQGPF